MENCGDISSRKRRKPYIRKLCLALDDHIQSFVPHGMETTVSKQTWNFIESIHV